MWMRPVGYIVRRLAVIGIALQQSSESLCPTEYIVVQGGECRDGGIRADRADMAPRTETTTFLGRNICGDLGILVI